MVNAKGRHLFLTELSEVCHWIFSYSHKIVLCLRKFTSLCFYFSAQKIYGMRNQVYFWFISVTKYCFGAFHTFKLKFFCRQMVCFVFTLFILSLRFQCCHSLSSFLHNRLLIRHHSCFITTSLNGFLSFIVLFLFSSQKIGVYIFFVLFLPSSRRIQK